MSNAIQRYQKRNALLRKRAAFNNQAVSCMLSGENNNNSEILHPSSSEGQEAGQLLTEIHDRIDKEKMTALVEACQNECLQAVVRPFGIGRILFEDLEGGNVATIHNVRSKEHCKDDKKTAYVQLGEKQKADIEKKNFKEEKEAYKRYKKQQNAKKISNEKNEKASHVANQVEPVADPKYKYRDGDNRYKKMKDDTQKAKSAGHLYNSLKQGNFDPSDDVEIDHTISIEAIKGDRGRMLAEIPAEDLANLSTNLNPLIMSINRSKGDSSVEDAIKRLKQNENKRLNDIKTLEDKKKSGLLDQENEVLRLERLKQLQEFIHNEKAQKVLLDFEVKSQAIIDRRINKTYYLGGKFLKNTVNTSIIEGGKMAGQQAIGILMEEFVRAAFAEVKDSWQYGFKGMVDDSFFNALKGRLWRIVEKIQSKWKDAAFALHDGFISGFFSNLVTVIINMFKTTSARMIRMAREGFMSLYRALKLLAFPPEDMSLAQAADAASKLVAAGIVTGGGILLEEALESYLIVLGPLASYVSSIVSGLVTGLCTVFVVYLLDKIDFFLVNATSRHEQVVAKLDAMISDSYSESIDLASIFAGPPLKHLG